jgi:hypothetical protein
MLEQYRHRCPLEEFQKPKNGARIALIFIIKKGVVVILYAALNDNNNNTVYTEDIGEIDYNIRSLQLPVGQDLYSYSNN